MISFWFNMLYSSLLRGSNLSPFDHSKTACQPLHYSTTDWPSKLNCGDSLGKRPEWNEWGASICGPGPIFERFGENYPSDSELFSTSIDLIARVRVIIYVWYIICTPVWYTCMFDVYEWRCIRGQRCGRTTMYIWPLLLKWNPSTSFFPSCRSSLTFFFILPCTYRWPQICKKPHKVCLYGFVWLRKNHQSHRM